MAVLKYSAPAGLVVSGVPPRGATNRALLAASRVPTRPTVPFWLHPRGLRSNQLSTPKPAAHTLGVGTPAFAGGVDLLSLLSSAKQQRVLEGSTRAEYRAGAIAFRPGPPARAFVVEKGLARVFMSARDGREATVAFVHPGNLLGARNLIRGIPVEQDPPLTGVQAVTPSTFTLLA